jgi:hypothetical protein
MSNTTITNLPVATALTGDEEVQVVQSNGTGGLVSRRTTAQDIADLAVQGGTVTSITASSPLTGGVITTSGTIGLGDNSVTNPYLATMAPYTFKANGTSGTVVPQDLTVTQTLTTLGIGNISSNTILGNISGSTGNPSAFTLSQYIDTAISNTQGSLLYRTGTEWNALAPGLNGQVLRTNGSGANVSWYTAPGTGTVTSVATGTGLTGGPFTISGTISIANTTVTAGSYGSASTVPTYTVNGQGQLTAASNTSIAIDASAITSGVLPIVRGGTNTSTTPTNGQLLIGNNTGYSLNTLTAGTGTTISNGSGTITVGLANTAVATGTYGSSSTVGTFTVDQQGRLTSASSTTINAVTLTTGTITTAPSNGTDITNKEYVDSVAQGLNFHAACNYATTTSNVYTVTYNNGTSGVGATLTNAGALAAFSIDSVTLTSSDIGNRLLIKNQANSAYNGVYTLTTVGSGSVAWVLTRATDYDTSGTGTNEIDAGDFVYILAGSTLANTSWVQQTPLPIVVGTTGITFLQFGAQIVYTAGTGLTLSANQFSITNTTVTANSYGSASTVPTYTVNAQGQLTAASNTSIAIDAAAITTGTLTVSSGGTGASTLTANGVLYGNGTSAIGATAAGTTGQVLTANTGAAPTWSSVSGVTTISFGTTGLTPSTATSGAVSVAGTLVAANGGTGFASYTVGDILYASTTTALSRLADVTAGAVLVSGGVGVAPAYSATPTLTSLTAATHYGGTAVGSSLTLQSTSGVGSTDSILMKVGNNGATTALSIATTGIVSFPTTGAIVIPASTTANQPTGQTGMLRFNTTTTAFEGYNGTAWTTVGGGATGGGTDQIFYLNGQTVTTNYSIPSGQNAGTFGPVTVNSGAVVTVPSGSTWSIV